MGKTRAYGPFRGDLSCRLIKSSLKISRLNRIFKLVFQMTIRMATCRELATNMDDMTKLHQAYWMLEKSNTPTALLLPWFPSAGRKNRKIATQNLCETLYGYVESRKKAKVSTLDAIDIFLSLGLTTEETIAAALAVIFTGVLNTGISCQFISYPN